MGAGRVVAARARALGPGVERAARAALRPLLTSTDPTKSDAANVAVLLRRQRGLCIGCVAVKLAIAPERVIAAVEVLVKTVTVDQRLSRCTICGRTRWALSLPARQ